MSKRVKELNNILLVEDNLGDVRLTQEALSEVIPPSQLSVVNDGSQALQYLEEALMNKAKKMPQLILLDLNLPRLGGLEVLSKIKSDENLKRIPVIVLTTSTQEEDIISSYNNHANCYLTKPIELDNFLEVIQSLNTFWFTHATLPPSP